MAQTPQAESVVVPETLQLIILSTVCKYDIKEFHIYIYIYIMAMLGQFLRIPWNFEIYRIG